MKKDELVETLKEVQKLLIALDEGFDKCGTKFITKATTRSQIESICRKWFEEIESFLQQFGVSKAIEQKYHGLFSQLLELSLKPSWKKTYQKVLDALQADFNQELLVPILKFANKIALISNLPAILENASPEEQEYLNESLGCAKNGFSRASMVLVWCAAVNRMQKTIEKLGFDEFNKKSEEMKKICEGRFKRFKKSFNVHSLSELRASVFDTDLLWVLEYWELIDANQHERLSICFTMRNNAAHPGEATITEPNLLSAFSDLKTIVFDNPKFKL